MPPATTRLKEEHRTLEEPLDALLAARCFQPGNRTLPAL